VNTGGRATSPEAPVNRGYGPDFTGLFVGDAAAFGIRTRATSRLQRRPAGVAFACYGFRDAGPLADAWPHSTISVVEGYDQREADARARHLGRLLRDRGGTRLNPSLGIVLTAQPFVPIDKLIVGIDGECSFPSNFTVPLGRARDAIKLTDDFFARNAADMARHGVTWTRLLLADFKALVDPGGLMNPGALGLG